MVAPAPRSVQPSLFRFDTAVPAPVPFARRGTGRQAHARMRATTPVDAARLHQADIVLRSPAQGATLAVEHALGLGGAGPAGERFVYLCGASGRRYVFSAVHTRHAGLYEEGVFMRREGERARLMAQGEAAGTVEDGALYVHLVSRTACERDAVRADLEAALA